MLTRTWTFDDILTPVTTEEFFTRILGKSCLHLRGDPDKFSSLLSWADINRILCRSGLDLTRVRVSSQAGAVPAEQFCRNALSGFAYIRVAELNALLADGAVLTIDAAEDISEPILEFCRVIERSLGVPVQAQIRCSCRGTTSRTQSYEHDMIVVELLGGSRWGLRRNDGIGTTPDGTTGSLPPALDIALNCGDLFYFPRGQAHSDRFLDEPCVSIAVIFKNPTGVEIAARLFDRLFEADILKQDVPRFASDHVQATYLTVLQAEIVRICTESGLLLGFMRDLWSVSEPSRAVSLPWCAIRDLPAHLEVSAAIRFPHQDTLMYLERESSFEIIHEGNRIRLDRYGAEIMTCVLDSRVLSVVKLAASSSMPSEQFPGTLTELINLGLVVVREPAGSAPGNPGAGAAPSSRS